MAKRAVTKRLKNAVKKVLQNNGSNRSVQRFKKAIETFNGCREVQCAKEQTALKEIDAQIDKACPLSFSEMAKLSQEGLARYGACSKKYTRKFKREGAARTFMRCGETKCKKEHKASLEARNSML